MVVRPLDFATAALQAAVRPPTQVSGLIEPGKRLGEQATALRARVQASVTQATLELGASRESREAYLKELEAQREAAIAEKRALRRAAAAEAQARKEEREAAALKKERAEYERERAAYSASELYEMYEQASRLDILA